MSRIKQAFLHSKRGQALVELTLIFPMLLTLTLGAVEMANLIYTYQVIHHVTAQGANIAARLGSDMTVEELMNQVVKAACPVLSQESAGVANCPISNTLKWRVIYTEIGPDTSAPGIPQPYIVIKQRVLGETKVENPKRVCKDCNLGSIDCIPGEGCIAPSIPNMDKAPGQSLFAFEVFYDYTPITLLGNFVGDTFGGKLYERSIF